MLSDVGVYHWAEATLFSSSGKKKWLQPTGGAILEPFWVSGFNWALTPLTGLKLDTLKCQP